MSENRTNGRSLKVEEITWLHRSVMPSLLVATEQKGAAVSVLPDRVDAGDGAGEWVYRRRGLGGRLRHRTAAIRDYWLDHGVPRDEDTPLPEDSIAAKLTATWFRKFIVITVSITLVVLMILMLPIF